MIEAYATGYPIRISTYGKPSSPPGDQVVVGFDSALASSWRSKAATTGASALAG